MKKKKIEEAEEKKTEEKKEAEETGKTDGAKETEEIKEAGEIKKPEEISHETEPTAAGQIPEEQEDKKKKHGRKAIIITVSVLAVLAALVAAFFIWEDSRTYDECYAEAGTSIDVSEFFIKPVDNAYFTGESADVDIYTPGDYAIQIRTPLYTHNCILHIVDTVPPTASAVTVYGIRGEKLPADVFAEDITDVTETTCEFVSEPDFDDSGKTDVKVKITDLGGNVTEVDSVLIISPFRESIEINAGDELPPAEAFLADGVDEEAVFDDFELADSNVAGVYTVSLLSEGVEYESTLIINDTTPPVISGVADKTVRVGTSVVLKQGVTVTDVGDPDPVLTVDATGLNINEEGEYEVTYTAVDAAGNETVETCTVFVNNGDYDAEWVYEKVDNILANILNDSMTDYEKVETIWWYALRHVAYKDYTSTKINIVQGAYDALYNGYGDCYMYASLAAVMYTRAGIKNMIIMKDTKSGLHYWNLVDIGDGWYHCDSTQRADGVRICMWTDEQLMEYSKKHGGTHDYDKTQYPDIN